ncbi:hypothetical protein TNCV_4656411 [Trichonephila clavipes]|nr:hypothetical protein TNCV_4656411 [Trichonephila clavipes]
MDVVMENNVVVPLEQGNKGLQHQDEDELASWSTSAYQALLLRLRKSEMRIKTTIAARGCEKNAPASGGKQARRLALERGEGRAGTEPSSYPVGRVQEDSKVILRNAWKKNDVGVQWLHGLAGRQEQG